MRLWGSCDFMLCCWQIEAHLCVFMLHCSLQNRLMVSLHKASGQNAAAG